VHPLPPVRAAAEEHRLRVRHVRRVSGLYLLPATMTTMLVSLQAGRLAARFGSRASLIAGCAVTTVAFALVLAAHGRPIGFFVASGLMGVGMGLSFAALGAPVSPPCHQGRSASRRG